MLNEEADGGRAHLVHEAVLMEPEEGEGIAACNLLFWAVRGPVLEDREDLLTQMEVREDRHSLSVVVVGAHVGLLARAVGSALLRVLGVLDAPQLEQVEGARPNTVERAHDTVNNGGEPADNGLQADQDCGPVQFGVDWLSVIINLPCIRVRMTLLFGRDGAPDEIGLAKT